MFKLSLTNSLFANLPISQKRQIALKMVACFEENIFCFVEKGSCKWKIGLNFTANLPSEFGNLSICLLDSRLSVLGRFLVEENQSSDKKEKLH